MIIMNSIKEIVMFGNLLKAATAVVTSPIAVAAGVVTMGGALSKQGEDQGLDYLGCGDDQGMDFLSANNGFTGA